MWVITKVINGEVTVMVSEDKWRKFKGLVQKLKNLLASQPKVIDFIHMEEIRAFFLYVMETYQELTPIIMELHLTIDLWRLGHSLDNWQDPEGEVERLKLKGE